MKSGVFVLIGIFLSASASSQQALKAVKEGGKLIVHYQDQPLLSYQYETLYPPEGVDPIFKRSGFIHPLNTPGGTTLTQIQPEDHYHHYGIWNPWTNVLFEGDTIDFWNLIKKQGTVRFSGFKSVSEEKNSCEFQVIHEHVVFRGNAEQIALREIQTIRVHSVQKNQYLVDLTFEYASEKPFLIMKYRYGGLGYRAIESWRPSNSQILTSEGKTRSDADGSLAKWILAQGTLGDKQWGLLILSAPDNYRHPEPVRIWPDTSEHNDHVFICYSPTKFSDWLLEPGKTYTLKYRLVVFDGKLTADQANNEWSMFAQTN